MADIKAFLKPLMPIISTAAVMGGPFAVAAAKALENKLNDGKPADQHIKIDPTADGIHAALSQSNDPEVLLKAQQADQEFGKTMGEQGIDILKIEAGDMADARAMAKVSDRWTPRIISAVVIVGWFAVNSYLAYNAMHHNSADVQMIQMLNRMLGTLDAALTLVLGFWMGSSLGSHLKDEAASVNLNSQS